MTTKVESTPRVTRIHWMDNLRTFIIFLVVLYHSGGVYESTGTWRSFWLVVDPATNDLVGIINLILNIFMMPVLFFISGYLTPASLRAKDGRAFLASRFKRLIIPWLITVLALIPLYKVIFLYARGLPQEHWTTYFHFSPGNISSQNWLWFPPVLFLFNVVYLLLAKAGLSFPNLSRRVAILGIFAVGFVYSIAVGYLFGPGSWTLTPLLDFENQRLLANFLIFLLGALYYRQQAFASKPTDRWLYIVACATAWIPVTIHFFSVLIPFLTPAGYWISPAIDPLLQWFTHYLSLLMLAYLVIETFWRYFDRSGKIWAELNRNSYYVYLIHVIVIGLIALLLLNTALPSNLKYLTLTVTTYIASNLIVTLARRAADAIRA